MLYMYTHVYVCLYILYIYVHIHMCQYIRAYASEGLGSHFQMHSDSSHVLPRELDKLAQSPLTSYWLHI